MNPSTYVCSKCKLCLPLYQFGPKHKATPSARPVKYYCIACEKVYKAKKTLEQKELGYPQARAYRTKNTERVSQYFKQNHRTHKEHRLQLAREYKRENKEKILILVGARRKRRKESQPSWAEVDKIRDIYALAAERTRATGIRHHVDHIFPLNGKYVCGLHVHQNLQVLTKQENLAKGNKHPDN